MGKKPVRMFHAFMQFLENAATTCLISLCSGGRHSSLSQTRQQRSASIFDHEHRRLLTFNVFASFVVRRKIDSKYLGADRLVRGSDRTGICRQREFQVNHLGNYPVDVSRAGRTVRQQCNTGVKGISWHRAQESIQLTCHLWEVLSLDFRCALPHLAANR